MRVGDLYTHPANACSCEGQSIEIKHYFILAHLLLDELSHMNIEPNESRQAPTVAGSTPQNHQERDPSSQT
jgi:hypothetical protein